MRKMKKVLAMVLATTLVGSLLVACGKGEKKVGDDYNGGKEVEISYWNSGLGTEFIEEMVAAFNKKQSDWYVVLKTTANANAVDGGYYATDDNTVDLYMGTTILDETYLTPLDDVLDSVAEGDSKTLREKFDPSYLAYEKAEDGHYYSLTWGGGVLGVVYNKEAFEKAGISEAPRTTNEMARVCDKLLDAGITPLIHYGADGGYWTAIQDAWQAQYDGWEYYRDSFYGCKDESGKSPSKDVFTKKDGRYQVLKAMEKIITVDYVYPGSNSQDNITMQTMFLNQEIGMMVNGSWLKNEMAGVGGVEKFGVMKTPVISTITDKLTTVKGDNELRNLVSAIDAVTDGKAELSAYQSGNDYQVEGKTISAADWEYVKTARNSAPVNYPGMGMSIPSYSDAIDGAKEFMKFYYSDAGYKIFLENLHIALPMNYSEGEIDTTDWDAFEKQMGSFMENADVCVSLYGRDRHDIFTNGGATPYAEYPLVSMFCSNNAAERVNADEAWDQIVSKIETTYGAWEANIK